MKINKTQLITSRLQEAFSPQHLEVIDESYQHAGHAGYGDGNSHFAIIIKATCFEKLSRVKAHQKIYQALANFFPKEIHALRIKIL